MSARDAVLRRVRAALADVPGAERPEDVHVRRRYAQAREAPAARLLERFCERVADYRASVERVAEAEVAVAVARTLEARSAHTLAVPDDLPPAWVPAGLEIRRDRDLDVRALDAVDAVLTGCALAVAETGTLVLDAGPGQGRRALTLVPDLHVCVVRPEQVVAGVPEAIARMHGAAREGRPLTLVSGPSATSDIELKRVEGVHGPRTLVVLVIAAGNPRT